MICQACGKKKATIHFTKIINDKIEEVHLCEACFNEENGFGFGLPFSFKNLFGGLFGSEIEGEKISKLCSTCGWNYSKFMKTGRLGCPECYQVFREELDPVLKGLHGHIQHTGKIPSGASERLTIKRELSRLEKDQKQAIKEERYEDAADYRDRLKLLRQELSSLEEGGEKPKD